MLQSIIAPQPKSKQKFPSIETNCKEGETKMLTAVPAEGYLALRQHRIILCAAPIFFQGCVSPLPCPHLRVGAFCLPSSARPALRAREWTPLQRVLLQAAADKKTPTAAAVGQRVEKPLSAREVPQRGGGREPCHSPKYFGQLYSFLPHRLRAEPPRRGGQGVSTPFSRKTG